jgi:hypothetical protein
VTFDEVVIGKVKANRRNKVLTLLAECQRQAGKTAHMKAGRRVQPFDIASRDEVFVRIARIDELVRGSNTRRAVAAIVDGFIAVDFDDLGVVHFRTKSLIYRCNVGLQAVMEICTRLAMRSETSCTQKLAS